MNVNTVIEADGIKNISPLDALWALFKSQPKSIRKAFTERVLQADVDANAMRNKLYVKQTLAQSLSEMKVADAAGVELPDAHDLFKK